LMPEALPAFPFFVSFFPLSPPSSASAGPRFSRSLRERVHRWSNLRRVLFRFHFPPPPSLALEVTSSERIPSTRWALRAKKAHTLLSALSFPSLLFRFSPPFTHMVACQKGSCSARGHASMILPVAHALTPPHGGFPPSATTAGNYRRARLSLGAGADFVLLLSLP